MANIEKNLAVFRHVMIKSYLESQTECQRIEKKRKELQLQVSGKKKCVCGCGYKNNKLYGNKHSCSFRNRLQYLYSSIFPLLKNLLCRKRSTVVMRIKCIFKSYKYFQFFCSFFFLRVFSLQLLMLLLARGKKKSRKKYRNDLFM